MIWDRETANCTEKRENRQWTARAMALPDLPVGLLKAALSSGLWRKKPLALKQLCGAGIFTFTLLPPQENQQTERDFKIPKTRFSSKWPLLKGSLTRKKEIEGEDMQQNAQDWESNPGQPHQGLSPLHMLYQLSHPAPHK
ncbi:hypothetical protein AMECASPLE_015443 [Ameca splendens]|uniref:Uncharacterized protein n=1 Tax=Ameca splendens TaxID=208324 RepID=A0ABV0ZPB7_9TELE